MRLYGKIRKVFMIGIGGSGMSGIAEILHNLGYEVSGSDQNPESESVLQLRSMGIYVAGGHHPQNLGDAQVVVYSSAITPENPELVEARRRGLLVLRRAQMLSELMRMKFGVAVSGSHGKTTTTSMMGAVFMETGLDPTIVVGGKVKSMGTSAKVGEGDLMVVEADESDGTFLNFLPNVAVITNIDEEHLDHYGSFEKLLESFAAFANSVPFYGLAILCADDPWTASLKPKINRVVKTYGLSQGADVRGEILERGLGQSRFRVFSDGEELGEVTLGTGGVHNVKNALAVITAALYLELPFERIRSGLASFQGVSRRFDIRHSGKITVVEDYGHHPTEIAANLEMAQERNPARLVVVFQPHRYTRTHLLKEKFPPAFLQADLIILTDIYSAGENPIPGVDGESLYREFLRQGVSNVEYCPRLDRLVDYVAERMREGDWVLFQGAGNARNLIPEIIGRIER